METKAKFRPLDYQCNRTQQHINRIRYFTCNYLQKLQESKWTNIYPKTTAPEHLQPIVYLTQEQPLVAALFVSLLLIWLWSKYYVRTQLCYQHTTVAWHFFPLTLPTNHGTTLPSGGRTTEALTVCISHEQHYSTDNSPLWTIRTLLILNSYKNKIV